jgi:GNAT superfamily N-acetyltransferase
VVVVRERAVEKALKARTTSARSSSCRRMPARQVERDRATSSVRAGTSQHFPIPICLIARLAVDRGGQGRGRGAALLLDALQRAVGAAELVGIRAVVVHALDDEAARFYEHFSFAPVGDEPRTLMVALAAVRTVLRTAS